MKKFFIVFLFGIFCFSNIFGKKESNNRFTACIAGSLSNHEFEYGNEGYAGAFSGICGRKLVFAGGTNYSEEKPWEGGTKIFYDKVYVYDILKDSLIDTENLYRLPYAVAYGASVTLPDGILCIGGNNSEVCFPNVFLMTWDEKYNQIQFVDFPDLPVALSYTSATVIGENVYVAGGTFSVTGVDTGSHFFKLDLSKRDSEDFSWETLASFPGMGRIFPVIAAQSNGYAPCIYLFSGRNVNENREISIHRDGLVYNTDSNTWSTIEMDGTFDFPVVGGSAFSNKKNEIIIVGGSSGELLLKEQYDRSQFHDVVKMRSSDSILKYKEDRIRYYTDHPGFSKDILIFNTVEKTLIKGGLFDSLCPIMTTAIPYKKGAIMVSGESKPGVRSRNIYWIRPVSGQNSFLSSNLKIIVLSVLLFGTVGFLFLYRHKRKSLRRED